MNQITNSYLGDKINRPIGDIEPWEEPVMTQVMDNKPGEIYGAISNIMSEVKAIGKDRRNQSFKYRGIDDIYNTVQPIMAKYKVFSTTKVLDWEKWETKTGGGKTMHHRAVRVLYRFFTTDGSYIESIIKNEGSDMGDKATNKALANAHKYTILQLLAIPTDEPDPDAFTDESGSEHKPAKAGKLPVKSKLTTVTTTHPVTKRPVKEVAQKDYAPSKAQVKYIHVLKGKLKISDAEYKGMLKKRYKKESSLKLNQVETRDLIDHLNSMVK